MDFKNTLSLSVLLVTLAGLPVFGGPKKNNFRNKPLIFKKKRKKYADVKKTDDDVNKQLVANFTELNNIENAINNIGSFACTKTNMFENDSVAQEKVKQLKNIVSIFFPCQEIKSLDIHQVVSTGNVFYWINWNNVPGWTDSVNSEKAKNCSTFLGQYTHGGISDDVDRHTFMTLIQEHYKIHIMPKDEDEGKRVIALLLYLLKNSADFRKYAYTFKFLGSLSTEQKDKKDQPLPVFVIYSVWGKDNAQNLLNLLAKALKEILFVGSPVVPRYNFTLPNFQGLTAAMGDADCKPNGLFDKNKNFSVCKRPKNEVQENQEPFELTLLSLK